MAKKKQLPPSEKSPPDNPVTLQVFKAEGFSGPLPPPHLLAKYNEAFEGCAERIVAMAETQARHRQDLEKKVVFSNSRHELFGQISALIIAVSAIGAGTYLTLHGKTVEGLVAILGTLASLVGVFIYGKRAQKRELAAKNPTLKELTSGG